MAFLQELASDKEKLLRFFLSDQTLVDLLTNEEGHEIPSLDLRYVQVFPYSWLGGTITDQKSYLCFSVSVPRVPTSTVKDVLLKVWIFTHEAIMRTDNGPRIDLIASAVDTLLNGRTDFGLGKVELKSTSEISPAKDFYGYALTYEVQDFNRICSKI